MDTIDRRSALRGILCVAVVAGFSASSFLNTVEATPLALEKDLKRKADLKENVPAVARRPPRRPVARPPRRPPRHRRRRRWVCWWHRGRRVCGWRW
jgi:hypothetical protein